MQSPPNAHVCTPAASLQLPHIALVPEGGRILRPLIGAKSVFNSPENGCYIWMKTPSGDAEIFLTRHPNEIALQSFRQEIGLWAGEVILKDTTGTRWRRTVRYVTSDTGLGDLVEVPL